MIKTALNTPCYIFLEDEFNSNIKLMRFNLNDDFGGNRKHDNDNLKKCICGE